MRKPGLNAMRSCSGAIVGVAWLAAIASAGAGEPVQVAVVVRVDVGEAPELAAWAERAKGLVEVWHPRIAELLASDGVRPPGEIKLVFKKEMQGVAATSGTTITIAANWVKQHPDDYGMVVHELTHAVQAYPRAEAGWLVEGIADYVRFFRFEPQARLSPVDPARQSYRDGYRTTAMFLAWVESTHDKEIVRKLNEALRRSQYRYELFQEYTGKSLDRLWADFLESPAARGRP